MFFFLLLGPNYISYSQCGGPPPGLLCVCFLRFQLHLSGAPSARGKVGFPHVCPEKSPRRGFMLHCCHLEMLNNFWNRVLVFHLVWTPQIMCWLEDVQLVAWALLPSTFQRWTTRRWWRGWLPAVGKVREENKKDSWEILFWCERIRKNNERNILSNEVYLVSESIVESQVEYLSIFLLYFFTLHIWSLKIYKPSCP